MRDNVYDAIGRPPCPTCGVGAGDPCRTPTFRTRAPHQARVASAIKVRVSVTLTVDVEAWKLSYGVDPSEMRADVQAWAEDALHGSLQASGCAAS
jgi:hypothetical protein